MHGHPRSVRPPQHNVTGVGGFPCNRCFDLGHTCVPRSDTGAGNIGRQSASDKDEEEEEEPAAVVARKLAGFAESPSPMDLAYLSSDPLVRRCRTRRRHGACVGLPIELACGFT